MCMQAEKLVQEFELLEEVDEKQEKERLRAKTRNQGDADSGPFLRQLTTQVLWLKGEKLDEEVATVVNESAQARQS